MNVTVQEMTGHTHHYDTLEETITAPTTSTTGEGVRVAKSILDTSFLQNLFIWVWEISAL